MDTSQSNKESPNIHVQTIDHVTSHFIFGDNDVLRGGRLILVCVRHFAELRGRFPTVPPAGGKENCAAEEECLELFEVVRMNLVCYTF